MKEIIDGLKERYKKELKYYENQIKEYLVQYGNDNSDYLIFRKEMASYYRGSYYALVEVENKMTLRGE